MFGNTACLATNRFKSIARETKDEKYFVDAAIVLFASCYYNNIRTSLIIQIILFFSIQ